MEDESLLHIVNCYVVSSEIRTLNRTLYSDEANIKYMEEIAILMERFYEGEDELHE